MKKAVFTVFTVFLLIFPQILQGNSELTAAGGKTHAIILMLQVAIYFIILFSLAIVFSVQYLRNRKKNYTTSATLKPKKRDISDKTETQILPKKQQPVSLWIRVPLLILISIIFCALKPFLEVFSRILAKVLSGGIREIHATYYAIFMCVFYFFCWKVLSRIYKMKSEIPSTSGDPKMEKTAFIKEKEKEENAWQTKPQDQWNQTDHQN